MPKEDIIRGLEGAMSKGESLQKAMYSFYNAGYKKEDVEEAARVMGIHLSQQESLVPTIPISFTVKPAQPQNIIAQPIEILKPAMEKIIPKPTLQQIKETLAEKPASEKPRIVQDVSKYEQKQRISARTILIAILSVIFLILLISLMGIFIFKDAILSFIPEEDSHLLSEVLKKQIPKLIEKNPDLKFLEIGCGSGLQLQTAFDSGVKTENIFSCDINPKAVRHCKKLGFKCVKSDLFSNISGKFDVIAFNPPYLPLDSKEPESSRIATTGGKNGSEIINK